jgi:hypothetical protein
MKYLFAPICAFHMYTVGCEVYYHPSLLLIGLHTIVCKCTLINFNQYNLKVYTYDPHFSATYCCVPPFSKAKFCGVPSRDIVKVGCAGGRKRSRNTAPTNKLNVMVDCSAPRFVFGRSRFHISVRRQTTLLRILPHFLSPSNQMRDNAFKLDNDRFILHPV